VDNPAVFHGVRPEARTMEYATGFPTGNSQNLTTHPHDCSPAVHSERYQGTTLLHVPEKLQASLDLRDVSLVFCVQSHLVFDRLVRVNHRAMIAAAKVKANGF
jgi:hypothetical protein